MKKLYLLILFSFIFIQVSRAQQKPQYNQYMLNGYLVNPALAGIENYTDLRVSYRDQWSGLAGAPSSVYISVHGPLHKEDRSSSIISLPARGKSNIINKLRYKEENDFKFLKPHMGVGGMIISDNMGPNKRLTAGVTYAYHLPVMNRRMKLSTGITAGLTRYSLNISELDFGPNADPVVSQYENARLLPEISLGSTLYGRHFFVGASVAQLFQNALDLSRRNEGVQQRFSNHYFLTGGYEIRLGRELALMPSVLVKYVQPSPVSVDLNLKASYLRQFWGGVSYRHQNAIAALAGFNLNTILNVGYAYEMATSNLNNYTHGSHEIMIGFVIGNTYRIKSPMFYRW
ncbi:MAG: type IX secretion system membrane protein PorP/SprF [Adhaeribacter sp.]